MTDPRPPVTRIAVGFDGSADAEAALRWAARLATQLDGVVIVVHAIGLLEDALPDDPAPGLKAAAQQIAVQEGLPRASVSFQADHGAPCAVLSRVEAPPIMADLLVVGSRGKEAHFGVPVGSTGHALEEPA